jgi:hypothetical protein
LKKEQEELNATNEPDEDGWVTVTPKNRKSTLPFTQRNIEKIKTKQKKKQQQMVIFSTSIYFFFIIKSYYFCLKQLVNFYKFQMRDSQKERKYFF